MDRVALRRLCVPILLSVLLFGIAAHVSALNLHDEYKIWCDCNGDGIADIVKTVRLGPFEMPESACPSCCCTLLRSEKIEVSFDPLPFTFPDIAPDNPDEIWNPVPSQPPTATVVSSLSVPYTDSGEALIDAHIRVVDGTEWYLQKEIIVDTGASITMFPKTAAVALGLNLKTGQEITLVDVSGSELHAWVHWIEIQFIAPNRETLVPIEIRAAFMESNALPILLGRRDVLQELDIIFQDDGFTLTSR